ncbi:MAG: hypothetical protein KKG76_07875, partial [Euryarchaeota archaeon]|nr:hypothetical protein [Euryarchaeota archaeon]
MGSRFAEPYQCFECHNETKPYTNVSNALSVGEHFKNGSQIKAASTALNDSSSCLVCHDLAEMKVPYTEDDIYNSSYSLPSHYGKIRIDLRTMDGRATNCSYCHQNASTAFAAAMIDFAYNRSISNHSSIYNSSNPNCSVSQCHNTGWIHNSTLAKPATNSILCLDCHGKNASSGLINFTGALTSIKELHNNSVNCTECHTNTVKDVHPVKYLNQDTTYSTLNTSAVNCTSCHQTKLAGFPTAPIIPDFTHSNTKSSGRKWGTYWDNTSIITACYFCHLKEVHSASILGNVSLIKGSNIFNDPYLANSTWCSACHYNDSTSNYKGYFIDPAPPEILNATGKVPSIASEGTTFYNHSEIENYNDSHCKNCHGSLLSGYVETSLNFSHRVSEGGGGKDCIACHNNSATGSPLNMRVDG